MSLALTAGSGCKYTITILVATAYPTQPTHTHTGTLENTQENIQHWSKVNKRIPYQATSVHCGTLKKSFAPQNMVLDQKNFGDLMGPIMTKKMNWLKTLASCSDC